jgi:uncharacterized membrane protein YcfT
VKSNGPKKSIEQRTALENRILAFPGGFLVGVLVSPIIWQFTEVASWREGLVVSTAVGVAFGLVFALFAAEKATKLLSAVLRILNPP